MALQPKQRLGPYEILSAIGAGGMGEVYRARDTRLDRIVAIKVLPAHLADDPERRERFEREARTIASLNHPHICTLHDIGRQDGIDFLVMEYLEGETLAQRLLKGPMPLEQVLQYAIEISDALDKAHRKAITHRDLKPGNIMLTKSGTKLLDFGLAKLRHEAAPGAPFSQLPTASVKDPVTAQGTILGTLQYMAPEQVEGKTDQIDARTDIFAFGAVVYEMASGKKAFEGNSQASVIARILDSDPPPISSLQPMTPPALDRIVKRCLVKEPDERCQSAKDLAEELKWITESGSQAGIPTSVITGRTRFLSSTRLSWSIAAALLVALLLGAFVYFRHAPQNPQVSRFFVSPPETWTLTQQLGPTRSAPVPLAVSPDGRRIAFVATSADGRTLLWVRSLDTLNAQPLTGTDGAARPFWSPDSLFLGFFADGKLKRIEVAGGSPLALCDAPSDRSGTWSQDGVIVFAPTNTSALQKVPASGGTPTAATVLGPGEIAHRRPVFLPDGRHFLYRAITGPGPTGPIYLASLDSTERKFLLNVDSGTVVYTQGYLLFLRGTTLMGQPFDPRRFVLTGEAFPIAEQIQIQAANPGFGLFSASQNGVLAYQTGTGLGRNRLVWFDRAGKQTGLLGDPAEYDDLELSPDGKRASVTILDQAGKKRDIWLYDISSGLRTRLTFAPADVIGSIWSPDGNRVVFNSSLKGNPDLYQKASSGAGAEEVLLEDNREKHPWSWSPDGQFILYGAGVAGSGHNDLFVLPLSGDRKPIPFLQARFNETAGQFSPDGRWVAYQSDDSGRFEVFVAPFRGPGGKWQVSTGGGAWPRWRRDGSELFYLTPDNKVMVAAVNAKGSSFEVGPIKPVLQTPVGGPARIRYPYDVSADGQRILTTYQEQVTSAPITVVLNWTSGLKR